MKGLKLISKILTVSILLFSCQNERSQIMALTLPKVTPTQQGKGITMVYTDSAELKIVLKAGKMLTYDRNVREPFTVLPDGVLVTFYNDKGKPETILKANYGIHYPSRKRMEVKYNVEVVNKDGEKLNTEHLIWDEAQHKIYSDAFVKITTAKEIIMGKGLESNQDFTNYQIKEVTGTIQLDNNEL
jgi:LPS export ABC transporter protein LptC